MKKLIEEESIKLFSLNLNRTDNSIVTVILMSRPELNFGFEVFPSIISYNFEAFRVRVVTPSRLDLHTQMKVREYQYKAIPIFRKATSCFGLDTRSQAR